MQRETNKGLATASLLHMLIDVTRVGPNEHDKRGMAIASRWRGRELRGSNLLDVEANGGNSGDDFTQLKFVENRCLTGGIESNHEDADFLLAEQASKNLWEGDTHGENKLNNTGEKGCAELSEMRRSRQAFPLETHRTMILTTTAMDNAAIWRSRRMWRRSTVVGRVEGDERWEKAWGLKRELDWSTTRVDRGTQSRGRGRARSSRRKMKE